MTISRQIHLVRRPRGIPVPDDFALVETEVAEAGEGEVQVAALLISVDPYMRPRLDADQPLGIAMPGGGIGRIVQSRHSRFREGDIELREYGGLRSAPIGTRCNWRFYNRCKSLALMPYDPTSASIHTPRPSRRRRAVPATLTGITAIVRKKASQRTIAFANKDTDKQRLFGDHLHV